MSKIVIWHEKQSRTHEFLDQAGSGVTIYLEGARSFGSEEEAQKFVSDHPQTKDVLGNDVRVGCYI